jgi:hypothetical protein
VASENQNFLHPGEMLANLNYEAPDAAAGNNDIILDDLYQEAAAEDVVDEARDLYEQALLEILSGSVSAATKRRYETEFGKFNQYLAGSNIEANAFTNKDLHKYVLGYLQKRWIDKCGLSVIYVISSAIIWKYRFHYERGTILLK